MRVAIIGAGAIGGLLAAHLARGGEDVLLIARGASLDAIRSRGLRVRLKGEERVASLQCVADLQAIAGSDVVFLAVKANQVGAIAADLAVLLGETPLVTLQNGLPWWYFQRYRGPLAGTSLDSVDPGGVIARAIDPNGVIGSVVYPAATLVAPGIIQHVEGDRFSLGELDGARTERVLAISSCVESSGLRCPVRGDIRWEIWLKLMGNAVFNPMSALVRSTLAEITTSEFLGSEARSALCEVACVAEGLGVDLTGWVDRRFRGAQRVGHHKTSMLQDMEVGKAPEVDALLGSVVEVAHRLDVEVPRLEMLYALTRTLVAAMSPDSGSADQTPDVPAPDLAAMVVALPR